MKERGQFQSLDITKQAHTFFFFHFFPPLSSKFYLEKKNGALQYTESISMHYLLDESYLYPSNQERTFASLDPV